ncbi:uncharacterized protein O3C94_006904 isoform 2-T2 [Discoglossus pictus]
MDYWTVFLVETLLLSFGYCLPTCKHYLNRRIEGVFHYDRHSRYSLTYQDAQTACEQDFRATLASRDQLAEAMKSGLQECRAGWISKAEVAYPRIRQHWNCGENKTGIISYGIRQNLQEKWDVFCYKHDDDCSPYDRTYGNLPKAIKQTNNNTLNVAAQAKENSKNKTTISQTMATITTGNGITSTSQIQPSRAPELFTTIVTSEKEESTHTGYTQLPANTELEINTDTSSTSKPFDTPLSRYENLDTVIRQEILSSVISLDNVSIALNFKEEPQQITSNMNTENMELKSSKAEKQLLKPSMNMSSNSTGLVHLMNTTVLNVPENSFQESQTLQSQNAVYEVSGKISSTPLTSESRSVRPTQSLDISHTDHDNRNSTLAKHVSSLTVLEDTSFVTQQINISAEENDTQIITSHVTKERTNMLATSPMTITPTYSTLSTTAYKLMDLFASTTVAPKTEAITRMEFPDKSSISSITTKTYSSSITLTSDIDRGNAVLVTSSEYQESVNMKRTTVTPKEMTFSTDLSSESLSTGIPTTLQTDPMNKDKQKYSKNSTMQVSKLRKTETTKEMMEFNNKVNSTQITTLNGAAQHNISVLEQNKSLHTIENKGNMTLTKTIQHNRLMVGQNIAFLSEALQDNNISFGKSEKPHYVSRDTTAVSFQESEAVKHFIGTEKNVVVSKNSNKPFTEYSVGVSVDGEPFASEAKTSVQEGVTTNPYKVVPMATSAPLEPPSISTTNEESPSLTTPSVPGNTTSETGMTNKPLDSCGGVVKGNTGQFQSPGFPQSYESDMNCTWILEAPLGYYIILDFKSLVLEEHRNCQYDYVLTYEGKESDGKELGRFCGSQHPPQLRTSSNMVTVVMRSDSSVELDGILVEFHTVKYISGIQLKGGINQFEGMVEVEHQGARGSICAKQWNNKDAQVACRQLGYSGPAIATRLIGDGPVVISLVSCDGNEAALENCNMKSSGTCSTKERAGVICQVLESCAVLKNAGVQDSGMYTIDPDGVGQGETHFTVQCDMNSDITTGITVVGHDAEGRERVSPCEDPGCYSRIVSYNDASMDQLKALTAISDACEQFVRLECRHIRFLDGLFGWWVSRDGHDIASWGGATTNSGKCACGENGECALGGTSCNCDANDDVWRMDEGALTDKSTLPVQEVRFGDTRNAPMEMAFHVIGKLRCWGTIPEPPILQSCAALKEAGISDSGRYIIDPDGIGQGVSQFEVFCDMSSNSGITVISHDSERRLRVMPCEDAGCYRREVKYNADLAQLHALTEVSERCEQFVRLDCRHIRFIQSGWGWWVSWDGRRMDYWGGANPATGGCACGKTGTCSTPDKLCHCDSNDQIWRTDDGFLRDKDMLPIQAVHFGDTNEFPMEMAYHTIGKLRCRGRAR